MPGITPGTYYVILRTDVLNQIPQSSQSTKVSASLSGVSIDAPALTLGTAQNGTLGQGQSAYYKVVVTSGQTLQISFDSQTSNAANLLYVSYGTMPTLGQFQYSSSQELEANEQVTVPTTQAGTYYILAYGASVPSTPENYTITAALVPFAIQAVNPGQVGTGTDTSEIDGSKFDNKTTFQLLGPNNTVVNDQTVYLQDSSTAFVTFNLTGMPTGTYTVQAVAGDGTTVQLTGRADGRPGHAGRRAGPPLVPQQGTTRQRGRGDGKLHQRKQHRRAGPAAPDQRNQRPAPAAKPNVIYQQSALVPRHQLRRTGRDPAARRNGADQHSL